MADEVDAAAGVDLGDLLLEDLGAADGAACGGHAGDEELDAVHLEDLLEAAPVGELEGHDGGADVERVEAEKAVAEDDGVLRGAVWGQGRQGVGTRKKKKRGRTFVVELLGLLVGGVGAIVLVEEGVDVFLVEPPGGQGWAGWAAGGRERTGAGAVEGAEGIDGGGGGGEDDGGMRGGVLGRGQRRRRERRAGEPVEERRGSKRASGVERVQQAGGWRAGGRWDGRQRFVRRFVRRVRLVHGPQRLVEGLLERGEVGRRQTGEPARDRRSGAGHRKSSGV